MLHQPNGTGTSFPRRLWSVSWKLVLFVGLFLALYIPFVLPFILYPETEYETIATARGRMVIELLAMVTLVLAALAMTRYADRVSMTRVGFSPRRVVKDFALGTAAGSLWLFVLIGALAVLGFVKAGGGPGPLNRELGWVTLAMLFNTVQQETLIHGYVQQMVRANFGSHAGVIVSSVLFVLLHWTLLKLDALLLLANLFVIGMLLGYVFLYSRSLWLPIGAHFGWNYAMGPLLGLPVTSIDLWASDLVQIGGPELWTGGAFGVEGGIGASALLLPPAVWMYLAWRRKMLKEPELESSFP